MKTVNILFSLVVFFSINFLAYSEDKYKGYEWYCVHDIFRCENHGPFYPGSRITKRPPADSNQKKKDEDAKIKNEQINAQELRQQEEDQKKIREKKDDESKNEIKKFEDDAKDYNEMVRKGDPGIEPTMGPLEIAASYYLATGPCFVEGTLVQTSFGEQKIEDIILDQEIHICSHPKNESFSSCSKVSQVHINEVQKKSIIEITLSNNEVITATEEHPFFIINKMEWVKIKDVEVGDEVKTINGESVYVDCLEYPFSESNERIKVYNLSVNEDEFDNQNYFVGHSGILVHNCYQAAKEVYSLYKAGKTVKNAIEEKPQAQDYHKSLSKYANERAKELRERYNPSAAEKRMNNNPLKNTKYTAKVEDQMKLGDNHAFPKEVDNWATNGTKTSITGGDGKVRTKIELPGSYKGKDGHFEWIVEGDGNVNHRLFVPKQ